MLPDYAPAAPAPKPKRKPAPEPEPARPAAPAPREAVSAARSGVNQVHRLLSFTPEYDPTAVTSARAQLEEALAAPKPFTIADLMQNGRSSLTLDSRMQERPEEKVDEAQDVLAEAMRSRRTHAIGADRVDFEGRDKVKRLTAEQYEAMDPRQKQAVDFNTMLVRAVKRDRARADEYVAGGAERERYDKGVAEIFGKDGGSDRFAPETLAVLKQIGFEDDNADLDDFLDLKAAIHAGDIKRMDGPEPTVLDFGKKPEVEFPSNEARQDRFDLSQMLAAKTGQLQEQLAKGQALLQTMNATAAVSRNQLVEGFGGESSTPKLDLGYGQTSRDRYYQLTFDTMARSDADAKKVLSLLNQEHPEDYENFLAYAANRLGNAERFELELGGEDGVKYRSPQEFRKLLGLGEEG